MARCIHTARKLPLHVRSVFLLRERKPKKLKRLFKVPPNAPKPKNSWFKKDCKKYQPKKKAQGRLLRP